MPSKPGDHFRYTLTIAFGDVLYTRVSHGHRQSDDPKPVAAILRDQLRVSEADFWACVEGGVLPPRPAPEGFEPPGPVLDAKLARTLIIRVGLSEAKVGRLTREEAVERWQGHLTSGTAETG